MLSKVLSAHVIGIDAHLVEVEVDISSKGLPRSLNSFIVSGELSLDGKVKPVRGALSIALEAKRRGLKGVLLPVENAAEAAVVGGISIYHMASLPEAVEFLGGISEGKPFTVDLSAAMTDCFC